MLCGCLVAVLCGCLGSVLGILAVCLALGDFCGVGIIRLLQVVIRFRVFWCLGLWVCVGGLVLFCGLGYVLIWRIVWLVFLVRFLVACGLLFAGVLVTLLPPFWVVFGGEVGFTVVALWRCCCGCFAVLVFLYLCPLGVILWCVDLTWVWAWVLPRFPAAWGFGV